MSIKGPFSDPNIKKCLKNKTIHLIDRASIITPDFLGYKLAIYNGNEFKTFGKVTIDHIGKKLGEFSATKKPAIYKKKYGSKN